MKYTKALLEEIVKSSTTVNEVLRKLGLVQAGGSHHHISKKIKEFGINTSHFTGKRSCKGKTPWKKYNREEFVKNVLIIDGPKWGSHLIKLKLFDFDLKERKCEKCNQNEIWNGNSLSLHLDHINGNHNDNRLNNLRILCPNCHSQTKTYSSKK